MHCGWGEDEQQEHKAAGRIAAAIRKPRVRVAGAQLASSIFPSTESGTLVHDMAPPTFKVGLLR